MTISCKGGSSGSGSGKYRQGRGVSRERRGVSARLAKAAAARPSRSAPRGAEASRERVSTDDRQGALLQAGGRLLSNASNFALPASLPAAGALTVASSFDMNDRAVVIDGLTGVTITSSLASE